MSGGGGHGMGWGFDPLEDVLGNDRLENRRADDAQQAQDHAQWYNNILGGQHGMVPQRPPWAGGVVAGEPYNMNYGGMGIYNTMAQDMSRNRLGGSTFQGGQFGYTPYGNNPWNTQATGGFKPTDPTIPPPQESPQNPNGGAGRTPPFNPYGMPTSFGGAMFNPYSRYGGGGYGGMQGGYGGFAPYGMYGGYGGFGGGGYGRMAPSVMPQQRYGYGYA